MAVEVREKLWTYEDYVRGRIPSDVSEIINGEEVKKMPTGGFHARLELLIGMILEKALKGYIVLVGEVALLLSKEPFVLRGADIVAVSKERMKEIPEGAIEIPPDLIVEIVSPSDSAEYVQGKMREYRDWGVLRQVWIYPKVREVVVVDEGGVFIYGEEDEVEVLKGVKFRLGELVRELDN